MTDTDVPRFEDALPVTDIPPAVASTLSCQTCGVSLDYAGRGRKPRYCDAHKRGGSVPGSGAKKPAGLKNDDLARSAVARLVQMHRIAAFVLRMVKLPETSDAIMDAEEPFDEMAFEALRTDPNLCKQILALHGIDGKAQLLFAYVLMASNVGPTIVTEVKSKRAIADGENL